MELNAVEQNLKKIYDSWDSGKMAENNGYSAMFRMGFPDEFLDNGRPLLMYVGQECLNCTSIKTQPWVRKYQTVQKTKIRDHEIGEGANRSPFWSFYRSLTEFGFNVVWNNLDKLHPKDQQRLCQEDAVRSNQPYGQSSMSVLQREIELLKPRVIVFAVGSGKYTASLASAFSIPTDKLCRFEPAPQKPLTDITAVLGIQDTQILWTYHPSYLRRCKFKLYRPVLAEIKRIIEQEDIV